MVKIQETVQGVKQGNAYGKWTVMGRPFRIGRWCVVVKCKCGEISVGRCDHLAHGKSQCCGACRVREMLCRLTTHGDVKGGVIPKLYSIWRSLKERCRSRNCKAYDNYGGRGISVCEEWSHEYELFRDWALANGYADGLEIDRIDNDGNYEPANCRFVTKSQNNRNRRNNRQITAFDETKLLVEWVEDDRCKVGMVTLYGRLHRGWPAERAISQPPRQAIV